MKIKLISGCSLDSITIDGKEERELTDVERKTVMYKLVNAIPAKELSAILPPLMEMFGEYEFIGHCDECDDDIEKYIWEI